MRKLYEKHKEIVMYLVFGVLTTAVSWIIYFSVMWGGRLAFDIPADPTVGGARYVVLYTAAQVVSWVCAVLFAFYTNRKWVFTDADKSVSVPRQLAVFASGRLITLGLDYAITLGGAFLVSALVLPMIDEPSELVTAALEVAVKLVAAIVVIIGNYVFSKIFVFRGKKNAESAEKTEKQ